MRQRSIALILALPLAAFAQSPKPEEAKTEVKAPEIPVELQRDFFKAYADALSAQQVVQNAQTEAAKKNAAVQELFNEAQKSPEIPVELLRNFFKAYTDALAAQQVVQNAQTDATKKNTAVQELLTQAQKPCGDKFRVYRYPDKHDGNIFCETVPEQKK